MCFACHAFQDRFVIHTHHPDIVKLRCGDCHVKLTEGVREELKGDVHSLGFFNVHEDNCYDPAIEKACARCHKGRPDAEKWAIQVIESWKRPVILDH